MPGLATSRVPIGLYSGTAAGLTSREAQLSGIRGITIANLPGWDFATASMGGQADSGFANQPRVFLIPNIHCRIGGTHLSWLAASTGTYDSSLIPTLQSIGAWADYPNGPQVYLSVQEEMDGADGMANHAAGRTQAQAVSDYRAWFLHVKSLVATYIPGALCGQVVADVTRLPTWFVPEADYYGADPHFYGWNANGTPSGGQFVQRMNTIISTLTSLGVIVGGVALKPWSMHVGGVERAGDPSAKANYITQMGLTLENAAVVPDWVTWWDRSGNVNGSTADERIDTTPQSLAAFAALYGTDVIEPPPDPDPPPSGVKASRVFSPQRRIIMMSSVPEPPQVTTGTVFTSVTSFKTGVIIRANALTGTLFTKSPTFFTGSALPPIDIVMLEDGTNTAASATYDTGTVTPTIDDGWLCIFIGHQVGSGTPNAPSIDASFDLGLTWTSEEVATNTTMRIDLLRAPFSGGAPSPGILRINFASSQSQNICLWSVLQIENADLATLFVQSDPSASSGASIVTHSLAAAGAAGNRTLLGTYYEANELANETWATTLSRLQDINPVSGFMVAWEPSAFDQNPFTDWTTNARWRSIACEVKKRTS